MNSIRLIARCWVKALDPARDFSIISGQPRPLMTVAPPYVAVSKIDGPKNVDFLRELCVE